MPELTIEQIKEKIVSGEIQAISVDTNIFDKYQCNLRHPLLTSLGQFRDTNVDVLLSEIVTGEIRAHLTADAAETQRALKKALKEHRRRWNIGADIALDDNFNASSPASDYADAELKAFVDGSGIEVVEVHNEMDLGPELVRRYFGTIAPFEARESKKSEFPDALALLSLEFHVKDNDGILLCVSNDGGWKLFASQSDAIVVINDLAEALSLFNQAGEPVVDEVVALWRDGNMPDLAQEVAGEIASWCADLEFDGTGDGPANWYIDSQEAVYGDIKEIGEAKVVSFGGKQITFAVKLTVEMQFYADFNFFVHDHVDRDEVTIGSATADKMVDVPIEATITASYEDDYKELDVIEVAIGSRNLEIDFGYVDPFAGEDPTFEKY